MGRKERGQRRQKIAEETEFSECNNYRRPFEIAVEAGLSKYSVSFQESYSTIVIGKKTCYLSNNR